LYILSGNLPIEALIDRRRLTMMLPMANNRTLYDLIHRQIAVKSHTSSSWIIMIQSTLHKYGLPHIIDLIKIKPSKQVWKKEVDKAINSHWERVIEEEAEEKSSTIFLNRSHTANKPHLIWRATTTDPRDVRRAAIKAKLLSGSYILQHNRAAFNQTHDTTCPLCNAEVEDVPHFLITCPALSKERDPILAAALDQVPLVYDQHPHRGWSPSMLSQLILDPTHATVAELLPMHESQLYQLEMETRRLCFNLHRARAVTLGYRP
jgi:hypothetical protein